MSNDWEAVARGHYLEGLLIDGQTIWYTDVVTGGVRRVGTDAVLLPERTMIGGLLFHEDGRLLVAGSGGIVWVDPASGDQGIVVDGLDGVNEICADGRGGLYFGTVDLPSILAGKRPRPASLLHLDANCVLTECKSGLAFANGLSPSADGTRLFFNESFAGTCAWQLETDGAPGALLWSVEKYDCDGMALDADGNVWISGFSSNELLCLDPDGRELRRLTLPGPACTNLRFGGADMRDLYVTIVDPAAAQALAEGKVPDGQSSTLFKTRSDVAGRPPMLAKLSLPDA
jgi:sugar lactone lactonase YvrE